LIKNLIKLGSYIKIHDPLSVDPRPVGMGVDERKNNVGRETIGGGSWCNQLSLATLIDAREGNGGEEKPLKDSWWEKYILYEI